ncbi:MAG TPA: MFS transporter [Streptosporangiaceae bacterium]|jgi:hypothetical protein
MRNRWPLAAASRRPAPAVTATAAVFFANGLLFASWTAHIPQVKTRLGLTDATLSVALLGAPAGSVGAMLASMKLLPRIGSRRMVQLSLAGYCAAGPLAGLTGSLAALFAALFAWGAFQGSLDVAMNTQAVAVEQTSGRPVMPVLHACWSIGAFAGAAAGVAGVALGLSLTSQLMLLGLLALVMAGGRTVRMVPDQGRDKDPGPSPAGPAGRLPGRRLSGAVLVLGAITFASMLCEGASADWASVYLHASLRAAAGVAGLGYAVFALAMVAVRLSGSRLLRRCPPGRLLPAMAALATVGFSLGLAGGRPATVIIGFGCLGTGLALVIPAVFSAAGRLPGLSPGMAIATVSAFGWAGFLCGPPLIGQLASADSLTTALGLLPALTAIMVGATALPRALRQPAPGAAA